MSRRTPENAYELSNAGQKRLSKVSICAWIERGTRYVSFCVYLSCSLAKLPSGEFTARLASDRSSNDFDNFSRPHHEPGLEMSWPVWGVQKVGPGSFQVKLLRSPISTRAEAATMGSASRGWQ
jgi:hypothetical protein